MFFVSHWKGLVRPFLRDSVEDNCDDSITRLLLREWRCSEPEVGTLVLHLGNNRDVSVDRKIYKIKLFS